MLYFHRQKLVFLEVPKTGSSAVAAALRGFAAMEISNPPHQRHMNAVAFNRYSRGFIHKTFGRKVETFAVMRDPVDRLVSWYRYLQRPTRPGAPQSTSDIGFADFVAAVLDKDPRFPGIGRQDRFLMGPGTVPLVTHIFQYDRQNLLTDFLNTCFRKEIRLNRVNVSAGEPVVITEATRDLLHSARGEEVRLWKTVSRTGHLHTPGV